MQREIVLSVIADDQPGIVQTLAQAISGHDGNWLDSSMSRLGGKFAGIMLLRVPEASEQALESTLRGLDRRGLQISFERTVPDRARAGHYVMVNIIANDRPGIVGEISDLLSRHGINIEALSTSVADTPMSSGHLFKARFQANLPDAMSFEAMQQALESASDDLMVEIEDHPWSD